MPVDHIEALGGIQTYISDPPAATNKMILFLADFYGPLFVKNQLLPISRLAAISSLDPITSLVQEARKPAIDAFPAWLDAVKAKYENDFAFPHASYRRAEDIMVSRKCTYYFQAFSGVKHRFAVRGGTNIETERWAKEESARGIKEWFDRFTA
ncbi:uncharacterized protein EDB91DRAFT_1247490 [Suillus paluster]|uniref:uncharacterized protein n=1 Tax=Suillus paluster TaxID=48578 RepID=UPI001B85CDD9|nr:uncharacterized protein EDB91DRAFT_1247490 [Suillus paluster]KAG1742679.1 hypothetical protein EDB91DRAFT_1247490 [Suillus paluster]